MITQLAAGFALGWLGSMPIAGAVSIFIFQRGLAGRMKAGLMLSAGAALAEAAWCLLAMLGAEQIMTRWPAAEGIARIVGSIILLVLGVYFFSKKVSVPTGESNMPPEENLAKDFWVGFSLVAGNISVPLNWLAILTIAVGLGFHPYEGSALIFVVGVAFGIVGWFSVLLKLLDIFRNRLAPSRIQRVMRGMGLLLIVTGVVAFFR